MHGAVLAIFLRPFTSSRHRGQITQQEVVEPRGARLEGPKLEPEVPRAEVGFPTADQGFSSIQGTLFGFYGI